MAYCWLLTPLLRWGKIGVEIPHNRDGSMTARIPENHPLCRLFREATQWAFEQGRLQDPLSDDPALKSYLSEEILARFVHVDNLYRLRDARGRRLEDIAEMLMEGRARDTAPALMEFERQRHIGDYALFITGVFPESLQRLRRHPTRPDRIMMSVGKLLLPFEHPEDYYRHQGKQAYSRAAELSRRHGLECESLFEQLAADYQAYVKAMSLVRLYLDASPLFQDAKRIIL
ncbi:MAG: hypothetical protein JSV65_03265 [Armatimonadota bacterium]|nr:MAG: hypothetical protein JSV65_03265 [Armatimonadota bacterium]